MEQIEREKVYLIKELPDLRNIKPTKIRVGNFYNPNDHSSLRIRQKGDRYELIKKDGIDPRSRVEHIIEINKNEFEILWQVASFKYEKDEFKFPLEGNLIAEIDIYRGKLEGFVRLEVEFENDKQLDDFIPPDWFGEEVSQYQETIYENISQITFEDMRERFKEKGIELKKFFYK